MGLYDRDYLTRRTVPRSVWSTDQYSMVAILIFINVVVYLVDTFSGNQVQNYTACRVGTLTRPWLWWQFLTYGFTHDASPQHIFFNMLTLWFFGRDIEYLLGRKEFLRLYLFLIVLGGVCWAAINRIQGSEAAASMIGASGAVVGIFVLFCLHYPRRTILLFFLLPVPAWVAGVLLLAPDVMAALQNRQGQIAYSVHLTGAALAALYYYQNWNFGLFWEKAGGQKIWMRIRYLFQRRPKLRVLSRHDEATEDDTDAEERQFRELEAEVERILDKINQYGTDSLTRAERRTLERASQLYRQRRQSSQRP